MSARIPPASPVNSTNRASSSAIEKASNSASDKVTLQTKKISLNSLTSVPEIQDKAKLIGQKFINAFVRPKTFEQLYLQYQTCSLFWQKFLKEPEMNPEKSYTFLWCFMQEYSPYDYSFSAAFLEQFLAQDDQHLFTNALDTFDRLLIRNFWENNWVAVIELIDFIKTTKPLTLYYKNIWLFADIQLFLNQKKDVYLLNSISTITRFNSFKEIEPTEADINLLMKMTYAILYNNSDLKNIVEEFNHTDVKTLKCAITLAALTLKNGYRLSTIPKSVFLYGYLLSQAHVSILTLMSSQQQENGTPTPIANSNLKNPDN